MRDSAGFGHEKPIPTTASLYRSSIEPGKHPRRCSVSLGHFLAIRPPGSQKIPLSPPKGTFGTCCQVPTVRQKGVGSSDLCQESDKDQRAYGCGDAGLHDQSLDLLHKPAGLPEIEEKE